MMVSLATGPLDRFGYVWHLRKGDTRSATT